MSTRTDEIRALAQHAAQDDGRDQWFRTRALAQAIAKIADELDALSRVLNSRTEHLA